MKIASPKCDFCESCETKYAFKLDLDKLAEVLVGSPLNANIEDVETWSACSYCHEALLRGDFELLERRGTMTLRAKANLAGPGFKNAEAVIRASHDIFIRTWEACGRPEADEAVIGYGDLPMSARSTASHADPKGAVLVHEHICESMVAMRNLTEFAQNHDRGRERSFVELGKLFSICDVIAWDPAIWNAATSNSVAAFGSEFRFDPASIRPMVWMWPDGCAPESLYRFCSLTTDGKVGKFLGLLILPVVQGDPLPGGGYVSSHASIGRGAAPASGVVTGVVLGGDPTDGFTKDAIQYACRKDFVGFSRHVESISGGDPAAEILSHDILFPRVIPMHTTWQSDSDVHPLHSAIAAAMAFMGLEIASRQTYTRHNWSTRKRIQRSIGRDDSVSTVVIRRAATEHHAPTGSPGSVDWQCQWIVSGHWRKPNRRMHEKRPIYVSPHIKGPDDKPLKIGTKTVYEAKR